MRIVKKMIPIYVLSLFVIWACSLLASHSVTILSEVFSEQQRSPLPTIVVDPGHGGEDGGAVSVTGVKESALNLEMGLRLRDLLGFLGFPIRMTRDADISIYDAEAETISQKKISDLKNRVRMVNETDHPLLISVHQNMFSIPKYKGIQVFYAKSDGSRALAEQLQSVFNGQVDRSNHRKAKECSSSYLMSRIHCTGILVECGFLSSPEEEKKLQAADYQKLLTAAICAGLTQQLSREII